MEIKSARLTLLIDPNKKAAFERLCAKQDRTPSQVVRQMIRDYLNHYGVTFAASGAESETGPAETIVHRVAPAQLPSKRSSHKRV